MRLEAKPGKKKEDGKKVGKKKGEAKERLKKKLVEKGGKNSDEKKGFTTKLGVKKKPGLRHKGRLKETGANSTRARLLGLS
jgi:hypothetical protein